jgi:NDP-sugar pyrophosphorylase family protein
VLLDADGGVIAFRSAGEPAPGEVPFLYTGVMVVARPALEAIPLQVGSIHDHVWRPAQAARRLGGAVVTGHWREVGTPRGYHQTVMELLAGRSRVHPEARVDPAAVVAGSLIGGDVAVAAGAVVAESVLSHGVVVGRGAKVISSVILGPVSIGPGEKVTSDVRAAPLV